jgi:GNAT superfamily N-acetyltransferase
MTLGVLSWEPLLPQSLVATPGETIREPDAEYAAAAPRLIDLKAPRVDSGTGPRAKRSDMLRIELSALYPEPGANHFQLDATEVAEGCGAFLVVYIEGSPVGCGALRLLDAETAELKRMYVSPIVRRRGLGRRLVAALEAAARTRGARRLVLETGVRQAAALGLYRAAGFHPIPLFGEYCLSPETRVCLGKDLQGQNE